MKKLVTLFLVITLLPAAAQPKAHSAAIKETRKKGGGKPAYTIDFKYPQWGLPAADASSKKLVQADVDLFKKSFQEDVTDRGLNCSLEGDYKIVYQNPNIISVAFDGSSDLAGAHPGPLSHALLVSPKLGKAIKISECFKAGTPWLKTISTYCHKALVKEIGESEWVTKGSAPTAANYEQILPVKDGLRVIFPVYQVASYADGPKAVLVPYSVVRTYIAPAGPLAGKER